MILGIKAPLKEGQTVPVTLDFKSAGKVEVPFAVKPIGGERRARALAAGSSADDRCQFSPATRAQAEVDWRVSEAERAWEFNLLHTLHEFLSQYGYWALALTIGLESMGLPLPGETILVMASLHAGHRGESILPVIAAAVAGAVIGDNIGYYLGRELGFRFLVRFGRYIGITDTRIKLGQYLFMRHGAKVVFFGRFRGDPQVSGGLLGRRQSAGVAPLSRRKRCGRHLMGDGLRTRRLHLRQGIRACCRPAFSDDLRFGRDRSGVGLSLFETTRGSFGGGSGEGAARTSQGPEKPKIMSRE